jgi:hypothetical protein
MTVFYFKSKSTGVTCIICWQVPGFQGIKDCHADGLCIKELN